MGNLWRIALFAVLALPNPALAQKQVYAIDWGSTQLGLVTFEPQARAASLFSEMKDTPFGLLDGTFAAVSRNARGGNGTVDYEAKSDSSHKKRVSTISTTASGDAKVVSVMPAKDQTKYTQPENVPAGVLNPVQAFERLVAANTCPESGFRIYDGRRVVEVAPKRAVQNGAVLTCELAYHIIMGPSHLRPFGVRSVTMTLEFDPAVAKQGPSAINLRSGLFHLTLSRTAPK